MEELFKVWRRVQGASRCGILPADVVEGLAKDIESQRGQENQRSGEEALAHRFG